MANNSCVARFDHQTREARLYKGTPDTVMSEFVFSHPEPHLARGLGLISSALRRGSTAAVHARL